MVAKDAELTTFVGRGELTADELLAAHSHFLDTGASRLTLWNLAAASLKRIDVRALRRLAGPSCWGSKNGDRPGRPQSYAASRSTSGSRA
jgi:hypothetical protein